MICMPTRRQLCLLVPMEPHCLIKWSFDWCGRSFTRDFRKRPNELKWIGYGKGLVGLWRLWETRVKEGAGGGPQRSGFIRWTWPGPRVPLFAGLLDLPIVAVNDGVARAPLAMSIPLNRIARFQAAPCQRWSCRGCMGEARGVLLATGGAVVLWDDAIFCFYGSCWGYHLLSDYVSDLQRLT